MEREQERGGKVEEERSWRKTGTKTDPATTIGVAEEATIASAGNKRACSDGRDRKDECGGCEGCRARGWGPSKKGSLCYGGGSRMKLLCLQGFWAYGPSLQESGTKRKSDRRKETGIWRRKNQGN